MPDLDPKVYFRTCVKELDCLVIVMVRVCPIRFEEAEEETVDACVMVERVNALVLDPLMELSPPPGITPAEEIENVMVPVAKDFVPSALCDTVVVPDAICREECDDMLCCSGSLEYDLLEIVVPPIARE